MKIRIINETTTGITSSIEDAILSQKANWYINEECDAVNIKVSVIEFDEESCEKTYKLSDK